MDTTFTLMIIEDDTVLARELCLSLKRLYYNAVAAERFDNLLEEFIAQGGDDYVEKPFHMEVLGAKIEAVLRFICNVCG